MIDLLAAKLTGDGGPRAVDPRSAVSAWRRAGMSDGEELFAGSSIEYRAAVGCRQLLLGGAVGTSSRIVLNASILDVPSGKTQAQANAEGPADSLFSLVDLQSIPEARATIGGLAIDAPPAIRTQSSTVPAHLPS
ncbi:MAG: hypothetical protein ACR2G6_12290 [Gemmatimonadaceae bacterium]